MSDKQGGPRRWLTGFGGLEWSSDESAYAALLDALTRDRVETEAMELEISAPLASATDIHRRLEHDELAAARGELDRFRAALTDNHGRDRNERGEVPYDSRVPEQDAAADVLIQYLVRPGYAEVRTDEPQPEHYVYYIHVDWERLRKLAALQGHPITL
jgi:hypothetical protein